jgi:hypothetical protein
MSPQRLKPHLEQCNHRNAEALRHPKSIAMSVGLVSTVTAKFVTLPRRGKPRLYPRAPIALAGSER